MLQVGIHNNIAVSATINDKGSLEVVFAQKDESATPAKEVSLLDSLTSGEVTGGSQEQDVRVMLFPLKATKNDGSSLEFTQVVQDIQNFQAQLNSILGVYYKTEDIKYTPYKYLSTPLTNENLPTEFQKDEVLANIYKAYSEGFVALLGKADKTKLARLLLVRRKADSPYVTLRNKFLKDQPFIEAMSVPADKSRLYFTKYEKEKGLDQPLVVSADANNGGDVSSLFGVSSSTEVDALASPFGE